MIRLLVADDNEAMRFGLAALMANEPDITVIGQAADGRSAVAMALADPPDVVLMDLSMPVLDGVAATHEILRDAPGVKVLVFTSYAAEAKRQEAISAGAHGYLLKGAPPAALLQAIRGVAHC